MNTNEKIAAWLSQFTKKTTAENIYKPKKRRWILRLKPKTRIQGDPIGKVEMIKTIYPGPQATFNEVFQNTIKYRTQ